MLLSAELSYPGNTLIKLCWTYFAIVECVKSFKKYATALNIAMPFLLSMLEGNNWVSPNYFCIILLMNPMLWITSEAVMRWLAKSRKLNVRYRKNVCVKTSHLWTKNINKNKTKHKVKHISEHNAMQRNPYTSTDICTKSAVQ